jgi:hypothetical protein
MYIKNHYNYNHKQKKKKKPSYLFPFVVQFELGSGSFEGKVLFGNLTREVKKIVSSQKFSWCDSIVEGVLCVY